MDYAKDKLKSQAERRQQKHAQKFGKAVQNQVLQEREAEKAKSIQKIEHLKKVCPFNNKPAKQRTRIFLDRVFLEGKGEVGKKGSGVFSCTVELILGCLH